MRRALWILVAIALVRIVSTYWVFNQTMDEPFVVSSGLEWLILGTHNFIPEHTPLPHIAAGIGAWAAGTHSLHAGDYPQGAPFVLYGAPSYYRALASARACELPFFLLATFIVWIWARRLHGDLAALAAVLLFTTLPPVLAHAGLATTDMSITAMLPAAIYALLRWLDAPGIRQTVILGLTVAGGVLCKLTFLIFFPVCVAVVLLVRWQWNLKTMPARVRSLAIAASIAALVIWAGYRFSIYPVRTAEGPGGLIRHLPNSIESMIERHPTIPVPAGEIYVGIVEARTYNTGGANSYLLGERRRHGWWYFFPVVFFYKTPLAFLVLLLLACVWLRKSPREHWIPLLCAVAILMSVLSARLDLGVRYVLPMYPLLAIPAGMAATRLIQSKTVAVKIAGGALVLWQVVASAAAHPDYIAYFNELAGSKPEHIRVDSDLDWGQNHDRLARRLKERGITERIGLALFGSVDSTKHGLANSYRPSPWEPGYGWIAISATERYMSDDRPPSGANVTAWSWLDRYEPEERVGGTILLYHITGNAWPVPPN